MSSVLLEARERRKKDASYLSCMYNDLCARNLFAESDSCKMDRGKRFMSVKDLE